MGAAPCLCLLEVTYFFQLSSLGLAKPLGQVRRHLVKLLYILKMLKENCNPPAVEEVGNNAHPSNSWVQAFSVTTTITLLSEHSDLESNNYRHEHQLNWRSPSPDMSVFLVQLAHLCIDGPKYQICFFLRHLGV